MNTKNPLGIDIIYQDLRTHPDLLPKHGPEYYAPRRKRRATSRKQQASSNKRQALNGASSNKR